MVTPVLKDLLAVAWLKEEGGGQVRKLKDQFQRVSSFRLVVVEMQARDQALEILYVVGSFVHSMLLNTCHESALRLVPRGGQSQAVPCCWVAPKSLLRFIS